MQVLSGEIGIGVVFGIFSRKFKAKLFIQNPIQRQPVFIASPSDGKKFISGNTEIIDDAVVITGDSNGD